MIRRRFYLQNWLTERRGRSYDLLAQLR